MSYTPTVYVDGQAPDLSAANLNHNESGLQAAAAVADAALPTPAGTNGQFLKRVGGVWVPTSFAASDIPSFPTDVSKALLGDGTWAQVANAQVASGAAIALTKLAKVPGYGAYRKTSAKQVVSSVAETDLLNGEITIAAGEMGTDRVLRLTAFGDWKQNSGGSTDVPRFKLKLGAATLIDTNIFGGNVVGNSANRVGWRIVAEIINLGATNSQWASYEGRLGYISSGTFGAVTFITGTGITQTVLNSATSADTTQSLGGNSSAVDTTASAALVLSVILPASSASCDIILKAAFVEVG